MKPTIEHARKILDLLSYGLVSGLGKPEPGKMCVEAAVCFALGLPHNDNPPCVGKNVRKYKIGLNDQNWDSNQARAEGMKELAIAQLGSNELDQKEFISLIFLETQKQIIPLSFDFIKEHIRTPEYNELKKFCEENTDIEVLKEKFKNYNYYYYNYYYNYNYNYNYYNNYYYYNYNYNYYSYKPEWKNILLTLSAKVGVDVLKQMKSPGCEWLHLCNPQSTK